MTAEVAVRARSTSCLEPLRGQARIVRLSATPFTALTSNAISAVPVSHDCVRLSVKNAATLWELEVAEDGQHHRELSGAIPDGGPPAVARSRPMPLTRPPGPLDDAASAPLRWPLTAHATKRLTSGATTMIGRGCRSHSYSDAKRRLSLDWRNYRSAPKAGGNDIHATPRTYYRSGMKLPLTLHPLPLFFRGRFGFVISGSAPDSSKLHSTSTLQRRRCPGLPRRGIIPLSLP